MGKLGKISSIKKEYNRESGSLEASLSANGYSRFPGTGIRLEVYKEPNGEYRTGLNPDAAYVRAIADPEQRKIEQERILALKKDLENRSGLDLGPRSEFYKDRYNPNTQFKAEIIRLKEGDNIFNFDDVWAEIAYHWVKVHPLVASSYQAYEKGLYPASTQFYVNDDNAEEQIKYKKKTLINKAIRALDDMSLDKRKKVARLLGLPVTDNTKEEVVYNVLDTFIKNTEVTVGEFKGMNPVDTFNRFVNMDNKLLEVKDLANEAIKHSIYRITKGGRITEGGQEIALSKEDLISFLMEDKNQDDLLMLKEKLNVKKIIPA